MYPVTELYKSKIKETTRTFRTLIQIQHSAGVLELDDKDIVGGSMLLTESSQTGEDFSIGGVVASTFDIEIFNKTNGIDGYFLVDDILIAVDDMLHEVDWYDEYTGINFEGATIIPQVGLLVDEVNDIWEYVPLGRFNIDEAPRTRSVIKIKAIDNMIELDKPYSLSNLSYPANLYQIYTNICSVADVQVGTTSFINQNYIVDERPEGDYTLRDVLGFVAELSGAFARFNRNGALELAWYTDTGITLTAANRFNFKPREDQIAISGVSYTPPDNDEVIYLAGTDEYVVDLSDNPLLQNNFESVISNIYNSVKDTVFTPYESRWQGNPAIQPGDKVVQIDRDGNEFNTIVTYSTYKYRGASNLAAKGMPVKSKRYKGSTNKKIANIVRKEIKPIGDKLTSLEQAQLHATELIANMLGGYAIQGEDAFYIADNSNLELAQKVWKWGLGGFGYSSTGVEGPYTSAITADGTIVAMLVAANIITADMVKTGILSSEDDSTWINLNDGTFNFKNLLKYIDGKLELNVPEIIRSDVSYKGTRIGLDSGIRVQFENGGHAQLGDGSILVQHSDGSYTKIDGRGIMRLFSIPIFEDVPTGTDITDNFETGNIEDTRIDLVNSEAFEAILQRPQTNYITVQSVEKYDGTYGLKIVNPPPATYITGGSGLGDYTFASSSRLKCQFLNYRPTKDSTFSFKYKLPTIAPYTNIKVYIDDLDYPSEPTQVFSLGSSTNWQTFEFFLTGNHTYRIHVEISAFRSITNTSQELTQVTPMYIDDMIYELDVNESVIVGYEEGTKPYNDFTYIKKDEIPSGATQKQVVLPDYFRGLNFDVLVTQLENYDTPTLLSINNKVPSFTVSGANTKFMYTVILNS